MPGEMPLILVAAIIAGAFLYVLAGKVSGMDDKKDKDKFTHHNLIAMIILYGGGGLLAYLLISLVK